MKKLHVVALSLFCILGGIAIGAPVFKPTPAPRFKIGSSVAKPAMVNGRPVMGATAGQTTPDVGRYQVDIAPDGTMSLVLRYDSPTVSGIHMRTVTFPIDCSQPVNDQFIHQVNAITPGPICTARTNLLTAIDTTIGTAAGNGKLNM